jgi:cytochrome d ubiquinol oxidase subunit II
MVQRPVLLPGLTVEQAAAPAATLAALVVAVLAGAVLLFPALGWLFYLVLAGRFDRSPTVGPGRLALARDPGPRRRYLASLARVALAVGVALLTFADAGWAHALGVICLLAVLPLGCLAVDPAGVAALSGDQR